MQIVTVQRLAEFLDALQLYHLEMLLWWSTLEMVNIDFLLPHDLVQSRGCRDSAVFRLECFLDRTQKEVAMLQQVIKLHPHQNGVKWILNLLIMLVQLIHIMHLGMHFPDDIFKCIFFNENVWIVIKISLKFVPRSPFNNIPSLV